MKKEHGYLALRYLTGLKNVKANDGSYLWQLIHDPVFV